MNETKSETKVNPKRITCLQFLGDKVIIEFEKGFVFQVCKRCQNGNHLKDLLNYLGSRIKLGEIDEPTAVYMEKRFYFELSRGAARRGPKYQLHMLELYAQKHVGYVQRMEERAANKLKQA